MRKKKANLLRMSLNATRNYLERLSSLLFFLLCFSAYSTNYYVASTGDNSDGSSWAKAYTTIQGCLTAEDLEPGDTVFLAGETFSESNIRSTDNNDNGFVFQGQGIDVTIVDAEGNNAVFNFSGSHSGCTAGACNDIIWHSMTIKDGINDGAAINVQRQKGADLYNIKIDNCDPGANAEAAVNMYDNVTSASNTDHIISNCIFENCNSTSGKGVLDVRMYPTGSATGTMTMTNCQFSNNSAGNRGIVYMETNYSGMHIAIDSCVFANNSATYGGALYTDESASGSGFDSYSVTRCTFYGNTASLGSAIYANGEGTEEYENCLFYENEASGNKGGVFYMDDNAPDVIFTNCTFTDNTHSGSNYGGIVHTYDFGGSISARNCIFYNNDNKDFYFDSWLGTITLDNCVWGSKQELDASITINNGQNSDPGFMDSASDDYHIKTDGSGSAYNNGSSTWAPSEDIEGTARPLGGVDDIGAFEGAGSCTPPSNQATLAGNSALDSVGVSLNWTAPVDGDNVLVIIREGNSAVTDPSDGTSYSANSVFTSGDDVGSSSYVVYNGSGTSVSVTGLNYATTYYVEIFNFNNSGNCYNETSPLTYNFTTDSCYFYVDDATGTDVNGDDVWCSADFGDDIGGTGTAANPYASINKVFDNHQLNSGCVIRVDNGSYNTSAEEDIDPDDNDDNFTIIGASRSGVTIDPASTKRAFYLNNNGDVTIKNLTINNGYESAEPGAGVYYSETGTNTLTLTGVKFSDNQSFGGNHGAGVYAVTSGGTTNLVVTDCEFDQNDATGKGGAIYYSGGNSGTATISRSYFSGNESSGQGSAIKIDNGASTITNCLFYENDNNDIMEDGVVNTSGGENHTIINCTFADNLGGQDCGYTSDGSGTHTVKNCIFWNNSGDDIEQDAGTVTFSYCIYESLDASAPSDGGNNSTSDPNFVDAANDDYDIDPGSPAKDAADETGAPSVDITNTARDVGNYDIGAYEQGNGTAITCETTLTWIGASSSSWNVTTNWSPNLVPCGNDVIINDELNDPVLDTKGDCGNITLNTGAILTWSSSDSLKVSGDMDINGSAQINHTGSGVLFLNGATKNITTESLADLDNVPFTIAGSYTFIDSISIDDLFVKDGASISTTNTKKIRVMGLLDNDGTVSFNGTSDTIFIVENLDNDGSITMGSTSVIDVDGNLDNASGKTLNISNGKLLCAGNFTNSGTFTVGGSSEVTFNGTDNLTIDDNDGISFDAVVISMDDVSDTVKFDDDITINGNLTHNKGLLTSKGTSNALTVSNNITLNDDAKILHDDNGRIVILGDLTMNNSSSIYMDTDDSNDSISISGDLSVNDNSSISCLSIDGFFSLIGAGKNITISSSAYTSTMDVHIVNAADYTITSNASLFEVITYGSGTLTVNSGITLNTWDLINNGVLTLAGTAILEAEGAFTQNGTFNENNSTVKFTNIYDQTVSISSGTETFYNVEVNKPGTGVQKVILNGDILITNQLILTDGQIWPSWSNTLTVDHGGDEDNHIIGGDDTSYISGPVIIENYKASGSAYADTLKVPVGDGIYYAPVYIMPSGTGENDWRVRYADTSAQALGADICAGELLQKVSSEDRFHIDRITGVEDAKIRLHWNELNSGITSESTLNDLVIAHWNNGSVCWDSTRADTSEFTRNWTDKWIETEFNVTEYSPFAFASRYGTILLPVELLSFEAELAEDCSSVNLSWSTASETNNDYFSVQKKINGDQWHDIGWIPGLGNSSYGSNYEFVDDHVELGITHYRLAQVDFDGSVSFSDVESVKYYDTQEKWHVNYISTSAKELSIHYSSSREQFGRIDIFDISGKKVESRELQLKIGDHLLNLGQFDVSNGIYLISLHFNNDIRNERVLFH